MSDIRNPATGENITFVSHNPEKLVFEDRIEAGKVSPPPHMHPEQDERFTLLEGEFELSIAGVWHIMKPQDSLLVPRGILHTFRVPRGSHATLRVEFSPALDTETVFRTMAKAGKSGRFNPLYLGLIATQTKAGLHVAVLPAPIQHLAWQVLGFVAKACGLKLVQTKE